MGLMDALTTNLTVKRTSSASVMSQCSTLAEIPGRSVVQSFGLVQYTQTGVIDKICDDVEGALKGLLVAATKSGANAVINVRLSTGTYQQSLSIGKGDIPSYIVAIGEAVVVE